MSLVPGSRIGKVAFFEAHLPVWEGNAMAIGLSPFQVAALAELTAEARDAYVAQKAAQDAARAATERFNNKVRQLRIAGAAAIRAIRLAAEAAHDPDIYTMAAIPSPQPAVPTPPPGTPERFRVGLLQTGAVKVSFKCHNPPGSGGTVYEVRRRLGAGGAFEYVGTTGVKSFVDETVPAGAAMVTYQITAIRSRSRGEAARFVVNLGVPGAGQPAGGGSLMEGTRFARGAA